MRTLVLTGVLAAVFAIVVNSADAQWYRVERYTPTGPNGYVYDAASGWIAPPTYGYGYAPGYYGYYGGYTTPQLPPLGFGSRWYDGYNDPYYYSYGPGVREFLRFGGADFYGW